MIVKSRLISPRRCLVVVVILLLSLSCCRFLVVVVALSMLLFYFCRCCCLVVVVLLLSLSCCRCLVICCVLIVVVLSLSCCCCFLVVVVVLLGLCVFVVLGLRLYSFVFGLQSCSVYLWDKEARHRTFALSPLTTPFSFFLLSKQGKKKISACRCSNAIGNPGSSLTVWEGVPPQ